MIETYPTHIDLPHVTQAPASKTNDRGVATTQQNSTIILRCDLSAASNALRDSQSRLKVYKQLVTTYTGLKMITRWVIESGILGQYQMAKGLLYTPGPPSLVNN